MYTNFFLDSDAVISHCQTIVLSLDNQMQQKYAGFVCVYAVSMYELAIKEIFVRFCKNKHSLFGNFFESKFEKINSRITIRNIKEDFLKHIGANYVQKFEDIIDFEEKQTMQRDRASMKEAYQNLITWRHLFAHTGSIPIMSTFGDVRTAYEIGKNVVHCLNIALN